jgi:Type IV secretion system pilin
MLFANIRQIVNRVALSRWVVLAVIIAVASLTSALSVSSSASAACDLNNMSISTGADCARGNGQPTQLVGDGGVFNRITSVLLFVVGAVAVVMLIFGGIRYIVSGGDQANVTAAKNTILYAIIGIIVALLAYAAVKFVTSSLLIGVG